MLVFHGTIGGGRGTLARARRVPGEIYQPIVKGSGRIAPLSPMPIKNPGARQKALGGIIYRAVTRCLVHLKQAGRTATLQHIAGKIGLRDAQMLRRYFSGESEPSRPTLVRMGRFFDGVFRSDMEAFNEKYNNLAEAEDEDRARLPVGGPVSDTPKRTVLWTLNYDIDLLAFGHPNTHR